MYYHHRYNDCCKQKEAPCKCDPIVLQPKVCVVNRYFPVEQPVIVPTHTRVINNYVPVNRYYPQYTTSEENCCAGGSYPTHEERDTGDRR